MNEPKLACWSMRGLAEENPANSQQPLSAMSEALDCPLTTDACLGPAKPNSTVPLGPAPIADPHNCKATKCWGWFGMSKSERNHSSAQFIADSVRRGKDEQVGRPSP